MFTYKLWGDYKEIKARMSMVLPSKYLYTEEEVAKTFLANAFLTPVSLMLDISTLPFQLGYLILIKLITYIIKRQRR
jgi:hypothetical protein